MRTLTRIRCFLSSLFHRGRTETDLHDELLYHLEQATEENIRSGMPAGEARFAAQRLLGTVSVVKEECRDAWGISFFETLSRDVRYANHMFLRAPLVTGVAIATLALGIGANAVVFTAIENLLLHPLQLPDSSRFVFLNWGINVNMSYPDYLDFRDRNTTFSGLIADRLVTASLRLSPGDNAYTAGYEATGNYFAALGVKPELGRFFGPADDKPGTPPVVVLGDRLWRTRLAADVHAIGRTVHISGSPFTVVGVAPPSFGGTEVITRADFWVPVNMLSEVEPGNESLQSRGDSNFFVMGRLRPGVSSAQAEKDLDRIGADLNREYPVFANPRARFELTTPGLFGRNLRQPVVRIAEVFAVVAGLVLLLACVNLAGMLLARAADRRREIGIRLAVGVGRWQLVRQLMTESLLLAGAGGALGYGLAMLLVRVIGLWRPVLTLPINTDLHLDVAVLGFALATVVFTSLLFGLAPALQTVRIGLLTGLRSDAPGVSRSLSLRDLLVTVQIAISIVLVTSAVLVVRSSQHALRMHPGIQPDGAVAIEVDFHMQGYSPDRIRAFNDALLARASAAPGVDAAGIVDSLPLTMEENNNIFERPDRPVPKPWEQRAAIIYNASPGYFRAVGARMIAGRDFDAHDRPGSALVVIVNEACAHTLYGSESPLGRRIRFSPNPSDRGVEIVGVVEDGKYEYLSEPPHPAVYMPNALTSARSTTLVIRSRLPASQLTGLLRSMVSDLDPELPITRAGVLREQMAVALIPVRIVEVVLGAFGILAMVLAATGLFALVAYAVSQRAREIGIRMALGARRSQVLSSVLTRTALLCSGGAVVGAALALAAGRLLTAVLYGVSPRDPATFLAALLMVVVVALLACWQPALRAIRIDPASTLREE